MDFLLAGHNLERSFTIKASVSGRNTMLDVRIEQRIAVRETSPSASCVAVT